MVLPGKDQGDILLKYKILLPVLCYKFILEYEEIKFLITVFDKIAEPSFYFQEDSG